VKIIEYSNEEEYKKDILLDDNQEVKEGYSSNGYPKGL